ncbi:zinc finger, SWIM-type containing 1, partial [Schistosoma haematobium]
LQKMTWTHYVVRESRLNKEKPEIRYEYVVYVCSFGHKKKLEGHGERIKGSKFSGCKAMFRLRYDVNRFVISSSRMIHNHPCDEKCLKNDPWFRRLNEDQLKVVRPMVETGSNANSIVKYAKDHFGKTITVQYVNNLKYKVVECCGSLNDVIETLRNSGKVFVSYGGVANQVTKIAFSTHEQIETYKRFPEVVCLDSTYNTSRGNYKLFQLHMVFTHLQMPEFTVDLVLKLCCRWTWTACGGVDVNIPAISSPDYTETSRLYRILRSKIHTLSTLFGQTTVQDILRQLIDQVDELIRMRRLPTDSEHNTQ